MIRGALLALLLGGCTVNALPGTTTTRLGAGDGGTVDLGPGDHGDGGGCNGGGGNVDLAWGWNDGGWPVDFGNDAGWPTDLGRDGGGNHYDGGPVDAGPTVDLAH